MEYLLQVAQLVCIVCQEHNITDFMKNSNMTMRRFMKNFTLFQHNKKKQNIIPLLLAALLLCSCSTISNTADYVADKTEEFTSPREGRLDFDLQDGLRFYKAAEIYTGEIITYVHPTANLSEKPTALFVPLGLVQNSRDHYAVSQGVSRLVYENFLAEKTFAALEYSDYTVPYRTEQMLPYARQKGADYLIGGVINQYYDGTSGGDSRFALQLFVYQVETGDLMWSLHHSGILPHKADSDFAFFKIRNRMPVNPMSTLISVVSRELAVLLHYWTDEKYMKKWEQSQKEKEIFGDPNAF